MKERSPRCIGNTEGSNLTDEGKVTLSADGLTISFTDYVHSGYMLSLYVLRWDQVSESNAERAWPKDFLQRLARADIRSLPGLLRWARERYPDFFYQTQDGGSGKTILRRAWADYLKWSDR